MTTMPIGGWLGCGATRAVDEFVGRRHGSQTIRVLSSWFPFNDDRHDRTPHMTHGRQRTP